MEVVGRAGAGRVVAVRETEGEVREVEVKGEEEMGVAGRVEGEMGEEGMAVVGMAEVKEGREEGGWVVAEPLEKVAWVAGCIKHDDQVHTTHTKCEPKDVLKQSNRHDDAEHTSCTDCPSQDILPAGLVVHIVVMEHMLTLAWVVD
jgi:hypothetical protein